MPHEFPQFSDAWHLDNIFYCIYDIDSIGARPQMRLVEALMSGEQIGYNPKAPGHTSSQTLDADLTSNLFINSLPIVQIFDPSFFDGPAGSRYAPPEYLGEDSPRIREMKQGLDQLKRAGRSFALRRMAGFQAELTHELTQEEAEEIAIRLNERRYKTMDKYHLFYSPLSADVCMNFVSAQSGVIVGMQRPIYEFWNNEGRTERTQYHAAKLNLMNAITAAAISKARSVGLDPDAFARNDIQHARRWADVYREKVPMPDVLLARSREVVSLARKYQR